MAFAFAVVPFIVGNGIRIGLTLYAGLASLTIAALAQMYVLNGMDTDRIHSSRRVSSTGPIRLFSHRYTGLISTFVLLNTQVVEF